MAFIERCVYDLQKDTPDAFALNFEQFITAIMIGLISKRSVLYSALPLPSIKNKRKFDKKIN